MSTIIYFKLSRCEVVNGKKTKDGHSELVSTKSDEKIVKLKKILPNALVIVESENTKLGKNYTHWLLLKLKQNLRCKTGDSLNLPPN